AVGIGLSGSAFADTVTLTVGQDTVPDEEMPGTKYGSPYDWTANTYWSDTSDAASDAKVNWHARYGADGDFLSKLFGAKAATLTINDIASISYNVKSDTEHWFLKVYTRTDGVSDQASWYGYSFTNNYGTIAKDNNWQEWSTDAGMFDLDSRAGIGGGTNYMDMSALKAQYGNELIEMISVQTDSGAGRAGWMDGLVVTLTDGSVGRVNFSHIAGYSVVVPTPSA